MKHKWKIITGLVITLVCVVAYAATETIRTDILKFGISGNATDKVLEFDIGSGAANPKLRAQDSSGKIQFSNDGSTFRDVGAGAGGGSGSVNILSNPDFEDTTTNSWANVGGTTFQTTSVAGEVAFGEYSLQWDPDTNSTLTTDAETVIDGLFARNCLGSIVYKGGDSNLYFQVIDGSSNVLNEQQLVAASSFRRVSIGFVCPSSGTLSLRIIEKNAVDAAQVFVDSAHLGENFLIGQVSQAQMAGLAELATTTNCTWTRTDTGFGGLSDTDCPGPTIKHEFLGNWQTTDTDKPEITINNLPPGRYEVIATFTAQQGIGGAIVQYRLFDGTQGTGSMAIDSTDIGDTTPVTLRGIYEYTSSGNRTFSVECAATSGACEIVNAGSSQLLSFSVTKFPGSSEVALKAEDSAWYVEATQGGGNPSLTTATVGTATLLENPSLSLTSYGTLAALQPCSGINSPGVSTCSVGTESMGIAFTPPVSGDVKVCATFNWRSDVGSAGSVGNAAAGFLMRMTNASDESINLGSGQNRTSATHAAEDTNAGAKNTSVIRHCEIFSLPSTNQVAFRMYFEQLVSGTVNESIVVADENAAVAERNIYWEAYPVNQQHLNPFILNHVSTPYLGGEKIDAAYITNGGGAHAFDSNAASWISSITDMGGVGWSRINFVPGTFPIEPKCFCVVQDSGAPSNTGRWCNIPTASTLNSVDVYVGTHGKHSFATDPGLIDNNYYIFCIGNK